MSRDGATEMAPGAASFAAGMRLSTRTGSTAAPGPEMPPPCLRAMASSAQDAFRRFDARSRDRERLFAFPVTFPRFASHPFARQGHAFPVTEKKRPGVLPTLDGPASRHTRREGEDASPRRLQPTYDTCTRWMTRCPTGGSRRLTERRRSRDDLRRRPVSEAALRVETCLTARRRLRPLRSVLFIVRTLHPRRCRPRGELPSDLWRLFSLSSRTRRRAARCEETQARFLRPLVKEDGLRRTEAPSIDRCSSPVCTSWSPPPPPRLCHRGAASDVLSLPAALAWGS